MRSPSLLFRQFGLLVTQGPGYCKHRGRPSTPVSSRRDLRWPLSASASRAARPQALNCDTQSAMRPFQVERNRPLHAAASNSVQEVRASHGTPGVPSPRVGVGAARRWP